MPDLLDDWRHGISHNRVALRTLPLIFEVVHHHLFEDLVLNEEFLVSLGLHAAATAAVVIVDVEAKLL